MSRKILASRTLQFGKSASNMAGVCYTTLGYWAKLKHGKRVVQPPLPPLKKGQSDSVALRARPKQDLPSDIVATLRVAEQELSAPEIEYRSRLRGPQISIRSLRRVRRRSGRPSLPMRGL